LPITKPYKFEKLEFSKEEQAFIDAMIEGKPTPRIISYWTKTGKNVEKGLKYYTAPHPKERLRR
jgi:hypothetical protein